MPSARNCKVNRHENERKDNKSVYIHNGKSIKIVTICTIYSNRSIKKSEVDGRAK